MFQALHKTLFRELRPQFIPSLIKIKFHGPRVLSIGALMLLSKKQQWPTFRREREREWKALRSSYGGDTDSDSDSDPLPTSAASSVHQAPNPLPPSPLDLLNPPNSLGTLDYWQGAQPSRVRSFPHVEGNYALHVYIPVWIPPTPKKELTQFLKRVSSLVPGLIAIDVDIPLEVLCPDDLKLEQVSLGREFHISLGRTVPIRVHQIESVVAMLRQKLQFQRRSDIGPNMMFQFNY